MFEHSNKCFLPGGGTRLMLAASNLSSLISASKCIPLLAAVLPCDFSVRDGTLFFALPSLYSCFDPLGIGMGCECYLWGRQGGGGARSSAMMMTRTITPEHVSASQASKAQ